jgi:hypothetical protein
MTKRETTIENWWVIANSLLLAVSLITSCVSEKSDLQTSTSLRWFSWGLFVFLLSSLAQALVTGTLYIGRRGVAKVESRTAYWFGVIGYSALSIFLLSLAVHIPS